jgi:hypothetical protein
MSKNEKFIHKPVVDITPINFSAGVVDYKV